RRICSEGGIEPLKRPTLHVLSSRRGRFLFPPLRVLVCLGVTGLVVFAFLRVVDMKPKVDEQFFFSKQDPQLRADNQILRLFPEPPRLILAVPGDIHSMSYLQRITDLTEALANAPGVASVESLSRGPKDIDDALKSRLWTRLLLAENQKASYIYLI